MLVANPDGSYALPTGEVAVLKPNEYVSTVLEFAYPAEDI